MKEDELSSTFFKFWEYTSVIQPYVFKTKISFTQMKIEDEDGWYIFNIFQHFSYISHRAPQTTEVDSFLGIF